MLIMYGKVSGSFTLVNSFCLFGCGGLFTEGPIQVSMYFTTELMPSKHL